MKHTDLQCLDHSWISGPDIETLQVRFKHTLDQEKEMGKYIYHTGVLL